MAISVPTPASWQAPRSADWKSGRGYWLSPPSPAQGWFRGPLHPPREPSPAPAGRGRYRRRWPAFYPGSWPQIAAAVDDPAICQLDALSALELMEQRPGRHAIGNQLGGVEGAGLVMLRNAIPIALHRMAERIRGDPIALFVEHQTGRLR